jgi:hypothetical protein
VRNITWLVLCLGLVATSASADDIVQNPRISDHPIGHCSGTPMAANYDCSDTGARAAAAAFCQSIGHPVGSLATLSFNTVAVQGMVTAMFWNASKSSPKWEPFPTNQIFSVIQCP